MSLVIAWVAFPLVLLLASAGLGLLVERGGGRPLPGVLVVPTGLAALMVLAQLATLWSTTARFATAAVSVLALAGLVAGRRRVAGAALDHPAALAALGVFAVFAAPIVLAGDATFAGYGVLGDTAIQFIGIDRLLEHGRTLHGLAPSSYQLALQSYFDAGYPFGAQVGLGAVRPLVAQDVAWVYQPYLAFIVACLALSLNALLTHLVPGPRVRAGLVFVAAQPALVFAYALQGSIKELGTTFAVALLVALAGAFVREWRAAANRAAPAPGARAVVPLAVATAAGLAIVGPAVAVWVAPTLLAALAATLLTRAAPWRVGVQVGAFAILAALLSYPTLTLLHGYAKVTTAVVTTKSELGNLAHALHPRQVMGIWLSGDYRHDPVSGGLVSADRATTALIVLALASTIAGITWAIRRRAWLPLLYVAVSALGCAAVLRAGSPWAAAKALTIASPAATLAALLGALSLAGGRRPLPVLSGLAALAIAGGVLGSNALAYHQAQLAPRDRLTELAAIGRAERGQGPTLYTEFEEFGKHFLRAADPEGVSEAYAPRAGAAARADGPALRFGYPSDLDDLSLPYVRGFRTIVLRRSPLASRPPAGYQIVSTGRWYVVWRRVAPPDSVLAHLPLGSSEAAAVPRCADVATLAASARDAHALLAFVPRQAPAVFQAATAPQRPAGWTPDAAEPLALAPAHPGSEPGRLDVRTPGRSTLWLGGSFGRAISVYVDERLAGRVGGELSGRGQYAVVRAGLALHAGPHTVRIVRGGASLAPGNGVVGRIAALVATPAGDAHPVVDFLAPDRWRTLCGRTLDWIEVVRRSVLTR